MKLLIEPGNKKQLNNTNNDGMILSLKDYAVQSSKYFTIEEIKSIKENNPNKEIFVNINKNILNNDIESIKEVLLELDRLNLTGIFFYDLALLKLKKDLNLKTDLVWSQTHMVNNYKTCNYYHSKGVKYALLGKEITLEEIIEIIKNTTITPMVEVFGYPSVAFSKRKLITNYYKDLNKESKEILDVTEKVTNSIYELTEDENGTSFFLKDLVNGTGIIQELYNNNLQYIIMRGYGVEDNLFNELITDTKEYINSNCTNDSYIEKYKDLSTNTNFFFKKTIYQVKKNG
ncbi:MAG: U32 family peptidase [Bacilli bacterium]|nr:U32 family peptidase [Bacilli bacterium]